MTFLSPRQSVDFDQGSASVRVRNKKNPVGLRDITYNLHRI